jgi:uncharacterized protein YndB with AHSA1/START domain
MPMSSTDCIRKEVTLSAPQSRVWRALSDSVEFGEWFGVRLEGPFVVGETIRGQITHPGCERMMFHAVVERMEPEHSFAFRWHPHATGADFDYSSEPTTLVEFQLEQAGEGTRLIVTESGFDGLPEERRAEYFMRNEGGWSMQMESIQRHVDG